MLRWVTLASLATLALATACAKGTDNASCGGINNSGTISGPITNDCTGVGGPEPSSPGNVDRHDTTTPAPVFSTVPVTPAERRALQ